VYPHQLDRVSATLEREGLRALVATTAANVFYLTGFASLDHAASRATPYAVWTPSGTALVAPVIDVPRMVADNVEVDHLMAFGPSAGSYADPLGPEGQRIRDRLEHRAPSPADALAAALDVLGVREGRVGLDEDRLVPAAWERLSARLATFTLEPAAAAFQAARRVKSPYEIECLGRALGIAEEAINAVVQMLKPGVTEQEAAALYHQEVLRREARLGPSSIAFGPRTWLALPPPSERALRAGELVRFDVGTIFKGYHGSVARAAVMGEPDPRQAAAADAVQAGLEAALDAVKPETTAGRIHAAAVRAARAAGLADLDLGRVGHGIGLAPAEAPELDADNPATLEAAEVLCIEVPHVQIGWGGVALRDTVLVTTKGSHGLNRSARGLVVLD